GPVPDRHPSDVGGRRLDDSALRDERGPAEGRPVHLQRLGSGRVSKGFLARRVPVGTVAATPGSRGSDGCIPRCGALAGAALGSGVSLYKPHFFRPSCSWTAAITRSGTKPNFFCSSLSRAGAPNVSMPMLWPVMPT